MGNNKLCLLWQNKKTRDWYHVGNLTYEKNKYYFEYQVADSKRNVFEALDNGYRLHPTFPNVQQKYESEILFGAFARRLPQKSRKDYQVILKNLGITEESTDFEVMSITGGTINSDNYEFVKPIKYDGTKFKLDFYLRGWRYYNHDTEHLKQGDELSLVAEPENKYDNNAVAIYKNKDRKIGYVPAFYSSFITEMINAENRSKKVNYTLDYEYDPEAPSQFKVEMEIRGLGYENILKSDSGSSVVHTM